MSQPSKTCLAGNDIFAVAHFHSKSESDEIIMLSESNGFEGATVHTASGHVRTGATTRVSLLMMQIVYHGSGNELLTPPGKHHMLNV